MKKITEFIIVATITIVLYQMMSKIAYIERGYKAYGGEIFTFALPVFYYWSKKMIPELWAEFREIMAEYKAHKQERKSVKTPKHTIKVEAYKRHA